jgi:hypothetical protein
MKFTKSSTVIGMQQRFHSGIAWFSPCAGSQSRKLKSRYGARNQFQEPSLELSSQATYRLAGRYDNPMPTWFLALIAGLKGTQA